MTPPGESVAGSDHLVSQRRKHGQLLRRERDIERGSGSGGHGEYSFCTAAIGAPRRPGGGDGESHPLTRSAGSVQLRRRRPEQFRNVS